VTRPQVLVLRALGLGDLLTSVPALRAVRDSHRDATITLAAPAWLAPLVAWIGVVDRQVDVPSLAGPLPIAAAAPDVAVDLHGRGPQSHRRLLATGPARLMAFRHPDVPASTDGPGWIDDEHEVRRWCRMVRAYGLEADERRLGIPPPPDPRGGGSGGVVLHAGAKDPARRWPADRWAAVARALRADGHDVVLTGSAAERAGAVEIARAAGIPPGCVVAGRFDVLGTAGVVAGADLVISGDTGVAHLAAALSRPSVALFGPSSPARWGPPQDRPHRVLWAGRTGDPHADAPFEGLLAIEEGDVVRAAREALSSGSRPRRGPERATRSASPRAR
jgi:hypothetical protein